MDEGIGLRPTLGTGLGARVIDSMPVSMVIVDPHAADMPIVYVNSAFCRMTGYAPEAVLGRNCRFLQGEDTDPAARQRLGDAIREEREIVVDLRNYRSDGTPFTNRLMITPLYGDNGQLVFFLGVQLAVHDEAAQRRRADELQERLSELQHRVKNHLGMILALIRLQARAGNVDDMVAVLTRRVKALSVLYEEFVDHAKGRHDALDLGAYVSRIASAIHEIDGRPDVRLNIEVEEVAMDIDEAGRLGLALSEIITNAFRHGFDVNDTGGEITVALHRVGKGRALVTVTDTGCGMAEGVWPRVESLGGRIVLELVERLDGKLSVERGPDGCGTEVALELALPSPPAPERAAQAA